MCTPFPNVVTVIDGLSQKLRSRLFIQWFSYKLPSQWRFLYGPLLRCNALQEVSLFNNIVKIPWPESQQTSLHIITVCHHLANYSSGNVLILFQSYCSYFLDGIFLSSDLIVCFPKVIQFHIIFKPFFHLMFLDWANIDRISFYFFK